jgi:hypothetical protein
MEKSKENTCNCSSTPYTGPASEKNPKCTCPNQDCPRHGNCRACVDYHRDEKGNLPVCLRPLAVK